MVILGTNFIIIRHLALSDGVIAISMRIACSWPASGKGRSTLVGQNSKLASTYETLWSTAPIATRARSPFNAPSV